MDEPVTGPELPDGQLGDPCGLSADRQLLLYDVPGEVQSLLLGGGLERRLGQEGQVAAVDPVVDRVRLAQVRDAEWARNQRSAAGWAGR